MKEFLKTLKEAERILQEAWDLILGHKKISSKEEKDHILHLISVIKSVLTLLERYNTISVQGFKAQDYSALKKSLENLQSKLEALC